MASEIISQANLYGAASSSGWRFRRLQKTMLLLLLWVGSWTVTALVVLGIRSLLRA